MKNNQSNNRLRLLILAGTAFLFTACADSKTTTEEEKEIQVMDSTEKVVKEKIEDLEDQTKKVEESLEKLDKETEDNK